MKVLIDTPIWSMALRRRLAIFTVGSDFQRYARHVSVKLFEPADANA